MFEFLDRGPPEALPGKSRMIRVRRNLLQRLDTTVTTHNALDVKIKACLGRDRSQERMSRSWSGQNFRRQELHDGGSLRYDD
jgi:hypothetical protein